MKILISRGNIQNAKSYPFWDELILLLKNHEIKEIKGILPEHEIIDLVNWSDEWISIDSFLPHLCAYHKLKRGIVLWGKSDPELFGYQHNVNLLKDRKYLRPDQFSYWTGVVHNTDDFVSAQVVASVIELE